MGPDMKKLSLLALLPLVSLFSAPLSPAPAPAPAPIQTEAQALPPTKSDTPPAPAKKTVTPTPTKPQEIPFPDEFSQKMSDTLTYENIFIKTVLALIGLLLIIFLGIWVLKKLSGSRTRQMNMLKMVKVLEKRPISPKSILYLVEVAGRKVLISESQLEVRMITQLDWIDIPPSDK